MKLYLAVPRGSIEPAIGTSESTNSIELKFGRNEFGEFASSPGLEGGGRGLREWPTPQTIQILAADGSELYRVHRASSENREYHESFPLGGNRTDGLYQVVMESLSFKQVMRVSPSSAKQEFKLFKDDERTRQ